MWRLQADIAAFDAARFTTLGPGYLALNLTGEVGELANVVKKLWRDDPSIGAAEGFKGIPDEAKRQLGDELADVVILAAVLANHLGLDLEAEAARKLAVIEDRLAQGYYGHEAKGGVGR